MLAQLPRLIESNFARQDAVSTLIFYVDQNNECGSTTEGSSGREEQEAGKHCCELSMGGHASGGDSVGWVEDGATGSVEGAGMAAEVDGATAGDELQFVQGASRAGEGRGSAALASGSGCGLGTELWVGESNCEEKGVGGLEGVEGALATDCPSVSTDITLSLDSARSLTFFFHFSKLRKCNLYFGLLSFFLTLSVRFFFEFFLQEIYIYSKFCFVLLLFVFLCLRFHSRNPNVALESDTDAVEQMCAGGRVDMLLWTATSCCVRSTDGYLTSSLSPSPSPATRCFGSVPLPLLFCLGHSQLPFLLSTIANWFLWLPRSLFLDVPSPYFSRGSRPLRLGQRSPAHLHRDWRQNLWGLDLGKKRGWIPRGFWRSGWPRCG